MEKITTSRLNQSPYQALYTYQNESNKQSRSICGVSSFLTALPTQSNPRTKPQNGVELRRDNVKNTIVSLAVYFSLYGSCDRTYQIIFHPGADLPCAFPPSGIMAGRGAATPAERAARIITLLADLLLHRIATRPQRAFGRGYRPSPHNTRNSQSTWQAMTAGSYSKRSEWLSG